MRVINLKNLKMKKISIFSFLAATLFLVSCEDVETPDLGVDEQWLQFGEETYTVTENSASPVVVEVFYAGDTNPNGVTVDYTVESENPDAYEMSPSGGTIEIPAGEFKAEIVITPIDNAETDGNKNITFTINNDDIPVGLVGEGLFYDQTTVTITDDDCELDLESFEGTYLANEFGYCDGCYEVTVTYDEENDVLVLGNLYETGGTTYISLDNSDVENPLILFRNYNDLGGLIDPATRPNNQYGDGYAINPSMVSGNTAANNISSFRTCDNFMDLYFYIYYPAAGVLGPVQIQLTKI